MIQFIHDNIYDIIERKRVPCKQFIRNDSYLFKETNTYLHIYTSNDNPNIFKDREE